MGSLIWIECVGVLSLLALARFRNLRCVRCRISSARVLEIFKESMSILGRRAIVVDGTRQDVDFIWTSSKRVPFTQTKSWNRLCGFKFLEDKRVSGELFNGEPKFFLESYAVTSVIGFDKWRRTRNSQKRYWVLKDARANGGAGLWFLDADDEASVERLRVMILTSKSEAGYTMQEYLPGRPLLWCGRKFHFRVAAVATADGRAFLHRTAFVHPANSDYTDDAQSIADPAVHVTNLCVNLALAQPDRFVGEVREDLITDRPELWESMLRLWSRVVELMHPFAKFQRSSLDFEYIGLDLIANDAGEIFFIEANCPPATSSATGYVHAETMHLEILTDLFTKIVCPRLFAFKQSEDSFGGFFECRSPSKGDRDVTFTGNFRQAQASADLVLMRFLSHRRKVNDT